MSNTAADEVTLVQIDTNGTQGALTCFAGAEFSMLRAN